MAVNKKTTKSKNTDIAIQEPSQLQPMPDTNQAEVLIAQAIQQGTPVETMEKLLAMRKELRAERAKEMFDKSMAKFQEECPVIEKKKVVNDKGGKERYKYATLDGIVDQVKGYIAKYDLSYSINVKQDEKFLTVVCTVKHKDGHSEESEFSVPIGNEQYMSEVQKYGARLTFAKRYAFCNAFGIMTGDEDNDALSVPINSQKTNKGLEMLKTAISKADKKQLDEFMEKISESDKYTENEKKLVLDLIDKRAKDINKK